MIKDGIRNFEIKIIGNNDKRIIPEDLRNFIKILGHINFNKMYKELENADFYLPLLNPEIESHKRYIETGTSGSFQLIRGFLLPPIIDKTFAIPHNFNEENSIIYENDFSEALKKSVTLKDEDYLNLQKKLLKDRERIIEKSVFELEKLLKSLISR